MERIILITVLLCAGLVLNLLSCFLPMARRQTVAIHHTGTRLKTEGA